MERRSANDSRHSFAGNFYTKFRYRIRGNDYPFAVCRIWNEASLLCVRNGVSIMMEAYSERFCRF